MRETAILLLSAVFFGFVLTGEMPAYMATVLTFFLLFCVMLARLPYHISEMEREVEELKRNWENEHEPDE